MPPLERTLIEKAGYDHGWENMRQRTPERVVMNFMHPMPFDWH